MVRVTLLCWVRREAAVLVRRLGVELAWRRATVLVRREVARVRGVALAVVLARREAAVLVRRLGVVLAWRRATVLVRREVVRVRGVALAVVLRRRVVVVERVLADAVGRRREVVPRVERLVRLLLLREILIAMMFS